MIPKIASRGTSFRGAAAYYLHDKGADTRERVAFCQTENLAVADPELAWRLMAVTAMNADLLKHDAGTATAGGKIQKPVYTLSLSWSPEEKPSRAEMIAAANSALKAIGLSKCQTLLVSHNDEPHPHIHAIVNLVDPDTGKIRNPGLDKRKLSRWAEEYEKRQGKIRCEQRVENNAKRDRGEPARDTVSRSRQDIDQEELIARQIMAPRRRTPQTQRARQAADREALKERARQEAQAIRARIREKFRPEWARLYQRMRQDAQAFRRAEQQAICRVRTLRQSRPLIGVDSRDWIAAIVNGFNRARAAAEKQREAQESELRRLRQRMAAERAAAVAAVWTGYRRDSRQLRTLHAEARRDLASGTATEKPGRPGARPGPRGAERYDALKSATPATPAAKEDARRREELEAELRRQTDEIARRRNARDKDRAPGIRPGPHRPDDYEALKSVTPKPHAPAAPVAPARDEEERRREELKAEFRRQAEEIARRRRERPPKDKDRDRDRER